MITKPDMMDALLAASPAFAGEWEAFRREWAGEADAPLYSALSSYAEHLIRLLEADDRAQLSSAFDAIESLHADGDAYVREAATIGILEDLQNENLHRQTSPGQFLPFLRPTSRRWWDRLNAFWSGDAKALQDEAGDAPAAR